MTQVGSLIGLSPEEYKQKAREARQAAATKAQAKPRKPELEAYESDRAYRARIVEEASLYSERPGMIYFIGEMDTRTVKIGFSQDWKGIFRRLNACQTGNPRELHLLAAVENGSMELEHAIHDTYGEYHIRGEWFDLPQHFFRQLERGKLKSFPKVALRQVASVDLLV